MNVRQKAIEVETVINRFAGRDNCFITADKLVFAFKPALKTGLHELRLRSLITKEEETELNNICSDCDSDFKKACDTADDLDAINYLAKRLKEISKRVMGEMCDE